MKITFFGGAMSVTGANYLLDFGSKKILVDCGLFQGSKYAEELNYSDFKYDPKTIDFVFLTHSHTDHIGRLPKLYREGFRGKVFTTKPTKDLMARAFPDNWRLVAEEAKKDNHEPLYEIEDIEAVMELVEGVDYYQRIKISEDVAVTFLNAGHILGSAIICFDYKESGETEKIYFSGDLGNSPSLLLPDKDFVKDAGYVVTESAYGSRVHEDVDQRSKVFREVVEHVIHSGGTLMIPSFAIERTQEMLFEINKLLNTGVIPQLPVFIDSPLAAKMTEVYAQYPDYLKKEAHQFGKNIFNFPSLRYTETTADSKNINDVPSPKIIIAGSGMSNGGRILHHERRYLSDPNSAIVFVGYQVEGSLGRKILDSSTGSLRVGQTEVKIFGENIPVRCLVKGIGGYSAHADQLALTEWVRRANQAKKLKKVFVVQGEESSAKALTEIIKSRVHVDTIVPIPEEEFEL
ncbi:MAG: MBL fold metallo-hydrolase [Candidatus Yanofskybacteria bacterium]|nr:MBL fold metallo-hydrolase [Candidatus Yanofskybacteria bacterium]